MTEQLADQWSPRGDPILKLLPAERPWAFDRLSFDDQRWRARIFLAVWCQTGSMPFAWANALDTSLTAGEQAWVEETLTDELLERSLKAMNEEEATA